jgi:hypothetical protein
MLDLSIIDTEDKAYFLGFYYADGGMYKNQKQICFNLSLKDKNHQTKKNG